MKIGIWLTSREVDCFRFQADNAARLSRALPRADLTVCRHRPEFLAALKGADAALTWRFDQPWFELAPKLRLVSTPAAGHEDCDVVPPEGVRVHYGSFHGSLMGETVIGMMLAAGRGILRAAWTQGAEAWPRAALAREIRPLRGACVVILGFGAIGRAVGEHGKRFGMRVIGVKRAVTQAPDYFDGDDRIVAVDGLDAALPGADHLVLCLPGGRETDRILDRRRLGLLPRRAWVYNVGRGNAIDEAALAEALTRRRIAGACLDVYAREPLPGSSPLRAAPNLLRMPHASAFSPTYMDRYLDELVPILKRLGSSMKMRLR